MGREVRRVPKEWNHPRDANGEFIPMFNGDNETAANDYARSVVLWECGAHPSQNSEWTRETCRHYWDYSGPPPPEYGERACHMFEYPRDDLTHYMLYENTSEGTPENDCPAFATMDELLDWAADNATTFGHCKTTREGWEKMLGNGFVHHDEVMPNGVTMCFC
jgi:hypothetical protein